ncbi:leucine-rich repeat protein [Tanacetum coccineum]
MCSNIISKVMRKLNLGVLSISIGTIPNAIGNLSLLTELYLQSNKLEDHIPPSLGNCKELNGLSGNITSSLGECISLTTLDLNDNILQGIIPSSFSSLRGLDVLDISKNNLSGKILQFLDKLVFLEVLNLSFNDLEGEVPVEGVFANASAFSILRNNRLCGGFVTLELPKCNDKGSKQKNKRNSQPSQSSGSERFWKVSYNELLKAIDGFSIENLIGQGGLNSIYRGILNSNDGKFVAVKFLHLQNRGAHKSFLAECEAWRDIRHRNLLKIITSCSSTDFQGNEFKALVYELMSNGSVHNWLHSSENTSKLNLLQRINILSDVATALDYLHNRYQTIIVYGDLKLSNILLDADMVAHLGDFEYGVGSEMSSIGDIYSFGILLLEEMTGKKPIYNEGLSLHKFAYMAFPDHVIDVIDDDAIVLQRTEANAKKVEECLVATIKIGVSCSVDSPP